MEELRKENVRLDGKNVIVDGANTGIGFETAKALAKLGAHVFVACRTKEKGVAAVESIVKDGGMATFLELNLASLKSVKSFAETFIAKFKTLDILVLNAGVDMMEYQETEDGIEMNWGVNHVAHFELTRLLLPAFENSVHEDKRVVALTSFSHWLFQNSSTTLSHQLFSSETYSRFDLKELPLKRSSFPPAWHWRSMVQGYALSKTANILFTVELAERWVSKGIKTYVLHPGVIATTLGVPRYVDGDIIQNIKAFSSFVGSRLFWGSIPNKKSVSFFFVLYITRIRSYSNFFFK